MWKREKLIKSLQEKGLLVDGIDENLQLDKLLNTLGELSTTFHSEDKLLALFMENNSFVKAGLNATKEIAYTFMNKNAELFDIVMDKGIVTKISNIRESNLHLLPMMFHYGGRINNMIETFNFWWKGRRIPASRDGVKELLWNLRDSFTGSLIDSLDHLAEKALGLSLSDQYWIRPSEDITWDKVNFFTNPFSEDIGKLLIEGDWSGGSLESPDNTSDGVIRKRWKIVGNTRCLIKSSTGVPWYAQPYREVFASKLARLMLKPFDIKFVVPYTILKENDEVYSMCPNFVTPSTEYVQFNQIVVGRKVKDYQEAFQFCCSFYGECAYVMDIMFLLDYLLLNEDRHTGNFGLIRDVNTGKVLRPAPIFDTGSSLFHNSISLDTSKVGAKPFHREHDLQVSLVDRLRYRESLVLAQEGLATVFWDSFETSTEDEERLHRIYQIVHNRIKTLLTEGS